MGLSIRAGHTNKTIHWGYSALHIIRDLALQTCGVNPEIARMIRSCHIGKTDMVRFIMAFHPEVEIKSSDFGGMQLAGYFYPNLLFHSDCGGNYTCRGRVMSDCNWNKGNIKKLKDELEILLENAKDIDNDMAKNLTQDFYELVKEECECSKCPKIYFY